MILNLTSMTEEELGERRKEFFQEVENGNIPFFTDQSDYYSDKLYETYEAMTRLRAEENERMIEQNDRERTHETGESCFDTALKGSKAVQKAIRK